ncbi:hypothetical protein BU17DRAFT_82347 [Hysterangium stoloniferum]|nr:hypothetical protein BU17DRAFT_82347 [Hysterangium stoloniferum]
MDDLLHSSRSKGNPPERPEGGFGVKCLAKGESPVVDIVAIHSLDGHRELSWTAENEKMWLKDPDMLPAQAKNARILTYGYNAATWGEQQQLAEEKMHDLAENFVSRVVQYRMSTSTPKDRPMIFIAHSMGGIILKFALLYANGHHDGHVAENKSFSEATKGILFIGTPHQGTSGITAAESFVKIYTMNGEVDQTLRQHLVANSETLQDQLADYCSISDKYITKFFYEIYKSKLPKDRPQVLVPKFSAVVPGAVNAEPLGLYKDHLHLVKFTSPEDDDYNAVVTAIVLMIRKILEDRGANIC